MYPRLPELSTKLIPNTERLAHAPTWKAPIHKRTTYTI